MNKLLEQLNQLRRYSYQIWHYNLSHSILTLRGTNKQKGHHNIHIGFADVKYFQFPFSWTGDLHPATDEEFIQILVRAGIGRLDQATSIEYVKEQFSLYKADTLHTTIYILGKLSEIEYDVEPIYN